MLRVESDGRLVSRYDHSFFEGVELPDLVNPNAKLHGIRISSARRLW